MQQQMMSLGQIAKAGEVHEHQVKYYLKSRNVQPACRAGGYRLFSAEQVQQILAGLKQMTSRKAA